MEKLKASGPDCSPRWPSIVGHSTVVGHSTQANPPTKRSGMRLPSLGGAGSACRVSWHDDWRSPPCCEGGSTQQRVLHWERPPRWGPSSAGVARRLKGGVEIHQLALDFRGQHVARQHGLEARSEGHLDVVARCQHWEHPTPPQQAPDQCVGFRPSQSEVGQLDHRKVRHHHRHQEQDHPAPIQPPLRHVRASTHMYFPRCPGKFSLHRFPDPSKHECQTICTLNHLFQSYVVWCVVCRPIYVSITTGTSCTVFVFLK